MMEPNLLTSPEPLKGNLDHDRLIREREFHDRQALDRLCTLKSEGDYLFCKDSFFGHAPWIGPAFSLFGTIQGRKILDLGSGNGLATVALCIGGADVTSLDISPKYLEETKTRCSVNGFDFKGVAACGERLPFMNESFDCVWGNAILHHLDLNLALGEINRVLKPGGKGVFCEPAALSVFTKFARKRLGKTRKHTSDEAPLTRTDLKKIKLIFKKVGWQGCQLFSAMTGVFAAKPIGGLMRWVDWIGERFVPFYQYLCRYVIVFVEK